MEVEIDSSPEMLRQYWIVENHGNTPVRVLHVVTKPRNEKGAYAELKSLNGFRRRCQLRLSKQYDQNIKDHKARVALDPSARMVYSSLAVWYDVRDSHQWQVDQLVMADPHSAAVPVVAAGGVFDMYALIGYDHRRDRYSAPPTAPASM